MKRKDLFGDKQTQYTIRKLSVGVASVATGYVFFFIVHRYLLKK